MCPSKTASVVTPKGPGRLGELAQGVDGAARRVRRGLPGNYRAIGRACVDNDAWPAAYEAIAPGPAAYQRGAIEAYAAARLG